MKVLVVIAHPTQDSFNHALLAQVRAGLDAAGHEVQVADLYAEGFQPAMIAADYGQFDEEPALPADVVAEQARVEWSDAVIFIFPLFWWHMPGMLKGWIDRVMSYGFAYDDPMDPDSGSLRHRKMIAMITAGASEAALEKRGYSQALHTALNVGIWDYCGMKDVSMRIFTDIGDDPSKETLERYLVEARELAENI
ncbi:MAG: NAD(P)H-dependent oxidoreductase [Pikeienuella sp.]